jgi:hypothetical protein
VWRGAATRTGSRKVARRPGPWRLEGGATFQGLDAARRPRDYDGAAARRVPASRLGFQNLAARAFSGLWRASGETSRRGVNELRVLQDCDCEPTQTLNAANCEPSGRFRAGLTRARPIIPCRVIWAIGPKS